MTNKMGIQQQVQAISNLVEAINKKGERSFPFTIDENGSCVIDTNKNSPTAFYVELNPDGTEKTRTVEAKYKDTELKCVLKRYAYTDHKGEKKTMELPWISPEDSSVSDTIALCEFMAKMVDVFKCFRDLELLSFTTNTNIKAVADNIPLTYKVGDLLGYGLVQGAPVAQPHVLNLRTLVASNKKSGPVKSLEEEVARVRTDLGSIHLSDMIVNTYLQSHKDMVTTIGAALKDADIVIDRGLPEIAASDIEPTILASVEPQARVVADITQKPQAQNNKDISGAFSL